MKKITKNDITALVLAGGRSSRMQGQDKGLMVFNGKPLITYALNVTKNTAQHLLISANRNIESYQQFGEVITDDLPDFQGPLAGIAKALHTSKTPYLLILPCDMPLIDEVIITRLIGSMNQNSADICVAHDGVFMHSTVALIKRNLHNNLLDFLASGRRKLGRWIEQNDFIKVDFSDCSEVLANFNSPEDLLR
ncbi:MAG: molybdenum cofactor guanylyltransferase [Candidatus Thioglobus sp.]|nr:MAG: molybdenum cofactor guanylyltransferase [Candidatus Thioglobus sp.]